MEKVRGYVVTNKKGKFYVNPTRFTNDLNKAKAFYSKATAKRVARQYDGSCMEVIITVNTGG